MAHEEKLKVKHSPESSAEHGPETAAGERLKQLEKSPERQAEKEPDQTETLEKARSEAAKEALSSRETKPGHREETEREPHHAPSPSRKQKAAEYDKTMKGVRSQLSKPSRSFSKAIHQPTVEKASDVVGASVARPNAILAGSFTAFVAVLGLYLWAWHVGFRLTGFEFIGAFAIGWIIGMLLDLLRVAFKRHRIS